MVTQPAAHGRAQVGTDCGQEALRFFLGQLLSQLAQDPLTPTRRSGLATLRNTPHPQACNKWLISSSRHAH